MKRWIPTREKILESRWVAPIRHHLHDDHLWHMDRESVARAVAIGLFFGLLLPTFQFLFAIVSAIILRAHVAVAAASTLVTNPLTFPPIYWFAYRLGRMLLGEPPDDRTAEMVEAQTEAAVSSQGWLQGMWDAVQAAGAPLVLGLAVLAVLGAIVGYTAVWFLWHPLRKRPQDGTPR